MQRNSTDRSSMRHPTTSPYARGQNVMANPVQLPLQLNKNKNNNTPKKECKWKKLNLWLRYLPIKSIWKKKFMPCSRISHSHPSYCVSDRRVVANRFETWPCWCGFYEKNVFDQYFLVLPTFHYEAYNSYAWLKPFEDKVFITTEYTPEMSQAFLARRDETIPPHEIPRTFLWMDDVGMNKAFRCDRSFVGLLSIIIIKSVLSSVNDVKTKGRIKIVRIIFKFHYFGTLTEWLFNNWILKIDLTVVISVDLLIFIFISLVWTLLY